MAWWVIALIILGALVALRVAAGFVYGLLVGIIAAVFAALSSDNHERTRTRHDPRNRRF